jgi:hypothetical protein
VYIDVPVYETWYTYSLWEWVKVRDAVASGSDNSPYWPETNLKDEQREGERDETCIVTFTTDKGKNYPYAPSCSEFTQYERNTTWQIKHNANRVLEVLSRE